MHEDEQAIRTWFDNWIKATTVGDLELARSLIADDAEFFMPGAGRMDKETFAAGMTADDPNTDFDLKCEIDEIRLMGDHAAVVSHFELKMTNKQTGKSSKSAGHSLSLIEKRDGRWVTVRDANTMASVPDDA
ncbi:MAG: nuclear transport factor 2 family protein [Planctomycetes bacterium]|nr:nuclear transport factor 2 family protein [Planctomycetota bacterium]